MIFRRLSVNLRRQNWTAITIEFVLLVTGVYLGVVAANWNQDRIAQRDTDMLLSQLAEELKNHGANLVKAEGYYEIPRRYAHRAALGWAGDSSVSDREFVVAAYQASQITGATSDASVMAQMFGAGELRTIKDSEVRRSLARVVGYDVAPLSLAAVSSPYRQNVRKVIPAPIQDAIRAQCGDRTPPGTDMPQLPATCDIEIAPDLAKQTAIALRSKPELQEELRWHGAAVANQTYNFREFRSRISDFTAVVAER